VLNLTVAKPYVPTAQYERKVTDHIALKAGLKRVQGNVYKPRSWGQTIAEFVAASRGISITAKAHFESKHHLQAAILRRNAVAQQQLAANADRTLSDSDYDEIVWNSNGVQKRLTREDQLRYGDPALFNEKSGASGRNRVAHTISRIGHLFHGACEMNSAPTGMTLNCSRPFFIGPAHEKSLKNKLYMFASLAFIGTAFTTALGVARSKAAGAVADSGKVSAKVLTKGVLDALIAFPAVSASMGVLGTVAGVVSQATAQKQALSQIQKEKLSQTLAEDMQKLVHLLKSIKGNPEKTEVAGKAMQGRFHVVKKVKACDDNGVPDILRTVLAAIDSDKTETENLNALKTALGDYLLIDKPPRQDSSLWQRYKYSKLVTSKESEYVALMSLVDHSRLENPHGIWQKDMRKHVEAFLPPFLRNPMLKGAAYPAAAVDKLLGTNAAGTLRKWASPEYIKKKAEQLADPHRAQKNCYNAEYMTTHIHQYKFGTRCLIKLSEALRITSLNVVLARNANLSRAFANTAATIQRTLGTGPASRCMCQSIGRAFGGAALACLFAFGFPAAAEATGDSYNLDIDVNQDTDASVSAVSTGILMFLLSIPSLALMLAATQTAKLEGWKGDVRKEVPKGVRTYTL